MEANSHKSSLVMVPESEMVVGLVSSLPDFRMPGCRDEIETNKNMLFKRIKALNL